MRLLPLLVLVGAAAASTSPFLPGQPFTRATPTTLALPENAPIRGYTTGPAFGSLSFDQPLAIVFPPGSSNRMFVVEKPGRIKVVPDQASPTASVFLDITSRVGSSDGEQGLLALAFHPDYATNGYFYVWYTTQATTSAGTGLHNRLERYQVSASDPNVADPASATPLISQFDEAWNHNGGDLKFGPDGYLYLSLGDEGEGDDTLRNSQRIDKDFFSGIIRIDVDQKAGSLAPNAHPAVHAGTYRIPPDNPFVGATTFNGATVVATNVRTEFWAVGLRNPWRMAFDPSTWELWCGDVGQGTREEINVITRGGNYGWNYREGTVAGPRSSPPSGVTFIAPVHDYANPGSASVTGGIVYRDIQLSHLMGAYVFSDYVNGQIWALRRTESGPAQVELLATEPGIAAFASNPRDGNILLADLAEGVIKRLVYSGTTTGPEFPATLSATGAFSSLSPLTIAGGLVPYEPNVSFWSDHARKSRWFGLRDSASTYGYHATDNWTFPNGAVWVKHFDLELTRGDPSTARHIETRFIVKTANGIYGLSYRWNDAQTDATLVSESGTTQNFTVVENGASRTQTWRFPSRSECFACHTAEAGFALSFSTRQLNRTHTYSGGTANQVTALAQAGYLAETPPDPATLPALVAPSDTSQGLERRVRSYLDANCAQCHRPDGATPSSWDARFSTPLALTRMVNGRLTDDGGNDDNRIIVPGDVAHSRLFHRISATQGATRMPPIATRERDAAAEQLIQSWIADLGVAKPASRLANLSGRALVGTGDNVLIPGFVVEGPNPRRVLIRAVGPGLSMFNVSGVIANPTLTLYRGSTAIGSNVRWNTAPNAADIRTTSEAVGAFALVEGSGDSAILQTLQPGAYTAHVSDAQNGSGIALFELYDTESNSTVRMINLSVRAQVGGGAGVTIPGLVISPGAFKRVLIRAVGPGLEDKGVPGFLPQPVLTLYSGTESFGRNSGWSSASNASEIVTVSDAVGAFPLVASSADAVILTTLSEGAYTLHVSSADATTGGVALVEVYEVP